jgi:hypothetical protein
MKTTTINNNNNSNNYFNDKDATYICIYDNKVGVVSYFEEEDGDALYIRSLDATEACYVDVDDNSIIIVPHGIIDDWGMYHLTDKELKRKALYWLDLKKDNSPHTAHICTLLEAGHTMEEAARSANRLNRKTDVTRVKEESSALDNTAKHLLDELAERKAHAKAKAKREARIRKGKRQLKSPEYTNLRRRKSGRLHLSDREKYALTEYSNFDRKPYQLVIEIDDYEEKQYTLELIEALRRESYYRRIQRQAASLRKRDKMLGTNREAQLWREYNKPYDKVKAENNANDDQAKRTPATYMVEGVLYRREDLEELYSDFRDILQSLDWAGEKQLRKVPTKNLAEWGHAVLTILNNEELLELYTETMPETKGGKAVYGVCPDCGELMLLDEGRDNFCPNCDKLVLENQLIYSNTPEDYGYTSYKGDWVDLGADVSYENLFRDRPDEDTDFCLDGVNSILDELGLDNEDVGL